MKQNNKTIPQGYKDSALGIIPQEWEVKRLGELCSIKGGFAFDSRTFLSSGIYQIIKMSNLYNGNLDLSRSSSFLDELPMAANDSILNAGDILITLTGTVGKKDYGYTYLITDETKLLLNQRVAKLVPHNICPEFIYPILKTPRFLTPFFYSSRGGTGNQTNVSTKDILDIPILYPPKAEQEKIAEILGVWDSAIEKQGALVDALTRRKRALMQQLLTAKKRLPNFNEPWEVVTLGDVCIINKGKALSSSGLVDGNYPVIAGGKSSPYNHNQYTHNNVITVSASGAYAGYVAYHNYKLWASDCSVVEHKSNVSNILYLYYLLSYNQLYIYSLQCGGAQPHIFPKDIAILKYNIPALPEQQAIAEVLSTADREIELAKKRLDAFRTQKRALMQQLLTGKKRVKL